MSADVRDFCRWKIKPNIFADGTSPVYTQCGKMGEEPRSVLISDIKERPYCPYCGKKIILEEEPK